MEKNFALVLKIVLLYDASDWACTKTRYSEQITGVIVSASLVLVEGIGKIFM